MSDSPFNQTQVKINNNNSFTPAVVDIELLEGRSFQKLPATKSKANIKLNPIHPSPLISPDKDTFNLSPQKNKLIYNEPQEKMTPSPQRKAASETSGASPLRKKRGIKKGYELANYGKARDYQKLQSYCKKSQKSTDDDYEPIDTCGSNQELRQYGLGVYLYFQFIKRLAITLIIMSAILILPLINNYQGSGLAKYTVSSSFTMSIARFTIGNISNGNRSDYLIITISDVLTMLVLFIFYIHWRRFHQAVLEEMSKDYTVLNPSSYVVSIEEFYDETTNIKTLEQELKGYFDSIYKGAFEVQIVYNYQGKFDNFIQLDQQIEAIQKESQIIKQTNKDSDKLVKEQKKLDQMEEDIKKNSQIFEPIYAIVHFRTLKAKLAFLNHCKRYRLQNTFGQALQRTLCCTPLPPPKMLFLGKFPIFIRNNNLSRPDQINWRNTDLSKISIFLRWVVSILLVVISIAICSAFIGFCTLYVASTSSCQNYIFTSSGNIQNDTNTVRGMGDSSIFCYCNDNFGSIYTNTYINSLCSEIQSKILLTNGLQIAASVLSSVTNAILGIIIAAIAKKLLRPNTIPKEYVFVFWGVLISNFINSCLIPLMLNANVYGVQFVSYLKFINFMNFSQMSIFNDFSIDWYAMISPYYMNIIIISSFISPIISVSIFAMKNCFTHWRLKNKCENQDKEDPIIQKEANNKITSLQFEFAGEHSQIMLYLLITIMYSGLIPLLVPVFGLGLIIWYVCKRAIVVKYSIKIPADETLNQSIINIIPFIILIHSLFSLWSHTASGLFAQNSQIVRFSWTIFYSSFDRIFNDIIILAQAAFIILVIVLDFTIVNLFGSLAECCKDELEMPVAFAAIQNKQYSQRLTKTNILGSYKLINNPQYGHALKAYNQLIFRQNEGNQEESRDEFVEQFT